MWLAAFGVRGRIRKFFFFFFRREKKNNFGAGDFH
jgi:hypothetical protein